MADATAETPDEAAVETVDAADGASESETDSVATEIAEADAGSDSMAPWVDPVDAPVGEFDVSEAESDDSEVSEMDSPLAAIYGIEFDGQDNRDRIVVLGDAPVEYKLFEPTTETLIVSLVKAKIDPEAAVRITPEPGGPGVARNSVRSAGNGRSPRFVWSYSGPQISSLRSLVAVHS